MKRRFFLFAAPAIVAAPSLMRVSTLVLPQASLTTPANTNAYTFTDIVTQTLREHQPFFAEQVQVNNAIFQRLLERGHIKLAPPGYDPDWDDYNT